MYQDSGKPKGPKDQTCPHRDGAQCSDVCQSCVLWLPVEFDVVTPEGKKTEKFWNCSHAWTSLIQIDTGKRMEAMRAELEALRKEHSDMQRSLVMILGATMQRLQAPPLAQDQLPLPLEVRDAG